MEHDTRTCAHYQGTVFGAVNQGVAGGIGTFWFLIVQKVRMNWNALSFQRRELLDLRLIMLQCLSICLSVRPSVCLSVCPCWGLRNFWVSGWKKRNFSWFICTTLENAQNAPQHKLLPLQYCFISQYKTAGTMLISILILLLHFKSISTEWGLVESGTKMSWIIFVLFFFPYF